jgi:tripartite ATP-independent transporter DctM subunit
MFASAILYLVVSGQSLSLAAEQMINGLYDSFIVLAVPLFIVAAGIMNVGSISDRLLRFCTALVGHFRGGIGQVNVIASLIFSGMSGSAIADAAGMGRIVIEMMVKDRAYPRGYAGALTAAAATIGPIIPPSIPMVLYALISDTSIGYLFLGGVVPGLLMGLVLMIFNRYMAGRRDFALTEKVPLRELPRLTWEALPALMMPAILLIGIYGGVTTPTEAAAVAATYALILAVFYRSVSWRTLYAVLSESARSSAAIGLIICGALIFNYIVASENIPTEVSALLSQWKFSPLGFLIVVNVLLLLLGCLLDSTTIILVILPIFIPTCRTLGIDLVHFGVVAIVNIMIGFITPPYGVLLFVVNATNGIPLREMIREIWAFIAVLVIALVLMIVFPDTVLWLPRMAGYVGD